MLQSLRLFPLEHSRQDLQIEINGGEFQMENAAGGFIFKLKILTGEFHMEKRTCISCQAN